MLFSRARKVCCLQCCHALHYEEQNQGCCPWKLSSSSLALTFSNRGITSRESPSSAKRKIKIIMKMTCVLKRCAIQVIQIQRTRCLHTWPNIRPVTSTFDLANGSLSSGAVTPTATELTRLLERKSRHVFGRFVYDAFTRLCIIYIYIL